MFFFIKSGIVKKLLVKTCFTGLVIFSLMANGTTGGGVSAVNTKAFMAAINRNDAKSQSNLKSIGIELLQDRDGVLTFVRDGKAYNLSNADLLAGETHLYQKKFDNIIIQLQNSSKRDFIPNHNLNADNVDLWSIEFFDSVETYIDRGYAIFGNSTTSMPSSETVGYLGRVKGYTVNKTNGAQRWIEGASALVVDFDKQTMTWRFDNFRTKGLVNNRIRTESYIVEIQNSRISGNGFSGTLSLSNNDKNIPVFNDVINGGFFGATASEIGATGQIETANDVITFAIILKQRFQN
ncbi:MAG: hypothetical protein COB24_04810 [Hyphomicrobiales bacterium]|nr:MAG: hypothetical protein COB24_04810 [Hyphomicrobiales bacterium]